MPQFRAKWYPQIGIPIGALAVGSVALLVGWANGGQDGFAIASGFISLMGLGVTAFAALTIWEVRTRYLRIIALREIHRRIERVRTEMNRATTSKEHEIVRECAGRLKAILMKADLQTVGGDDVEWILRKISEIETVDNRSVHRLVRELLSRMGTVIERIEIGVHQEETRASDAQ